MKPKPFEIIVEFTPQCTKTGITYEAHQKGSLIRCKDCRFCGDEPYEGTHVYICNRTMGSRSEGQRTAKGFCAWAEPKEIADE